MKKEIIICLVIVIGIVIGDIFLQNYTKNSLNEINNKLSDLKEELIKSDDINTQINDIILSMDEINNEWNQKFNILTCFLEHDELEKVKTQLVAISAGIDIKDKRYIYEELNKTIYILEHIRDKQSFKIDNIF
ncbi:MAG: DUF4363 family protein [Clostridia bacterium]|nr:DUF4363 family protein [Clostridia bacterium]